MAHQAQIGYCEKIKYQFPKYFKGKKVLDAGSCDINGNNRYLFEDCEYVGVDVAPGKNVDVVAKIHELDYPDETFDVIISTECFEHDMYWKQSLWNILRMLKKGGLFLFTCATTGRAEHGTARSGAEFSNTSKIEGWQDYYQNLTETDIKNEIDAGCMFETFRFETNNVNHDLYFYGVARSDESPTPEVALLCMSFIPDNKYHAIINTMEQSYPHDKLHLVILHQPPYPMHILNHELDFSLIELNVPYDWCAAWMFKLETCLEYCKAHDIKYMAWWDEDDRFPYDYIEDAMCDLLASDSDIVTNIDNWHIKADSIMVETYLNTIGNMVGKVEVFDKAFQELKKRYPTGIKADGEYNVPDMAIDFDYFQMLKKGNIGTHGKLRYYRFHSRTNTKYMRDPKWNVDVKYLENGYIYIEKKETMFVTFYTPNYAKFLPQFKDYMDRYNRKYVAYAAPEKGNWHLNDAMKPSYILQALNEYPDYNVVWLDIDTHIHDDLPIFDNIKCDIAAYRFQMYSKANQWMSKIYKYVTDWAWSAGTIFFANNAKVKEFCRLWIEDCEKDPYKKVGDQANFNNTVFGYADKLGIVLVDLPSSYCYHDVSYMTVHDRPNWVHISHKCEAQYTRDNRPRTPSTHDRYKNAGLI